jgi:pyrroline-5-carboxylate reductase
MPLAIIGGGNMAQAIVRGGIEAGVLDPSRIVIAEPEAAKRDHFRRAGIHNADTAPDALRWLIEQETPEAPGQVLLAIKPQSLMAVGRELTGPLRSSPHRRIIISILAGAPTQRIRALLGYADIGVVRLMPNLAVQIRQGITAVAMGAGTAEGDDDVASELFAALGHTVRIDESLMDAFTAVAGSGPAYLFYLAEAMTRAATDLGFDRDAAHWIVRWTLTGAASLLDATDQPAGTLRAAVTSPGGTTAAATEVLENAMVMDHFLRAIRAARDRGHELSKG